PTVSTRSSRRANDRCQQCDRRDWRSSARGCSDTMRPVKKLTLFLFFIAIAAHAAPKRNVEIIRDDWGIAHVYGKTDADAVYGMIYAQGEDDFNRVEHNYLLQLCRFAAIDGEGES